MELETTGRLNSILKSCDENGIADFLSEQQADLVGKDAFAEYFRSCLKKHDIRQQEAFLAADIPERYGYRLITGEKHTRQRDTILRLCLGGKFTLREVTRALELYRMPVLYARVPRDAVLIIAFNTGIYDLPHVDELLLQHGCEPLRPVGNES